MGIFDDTQPFQTVVVAPGRSINYNRSWYGPGSIVVLPTDEAEGLAVTGYIVRPVTSAAFFTTLSLPAQAALADIGITAANADDAILGLVAKIAAMGTL